MKEGVLDILIYLFENYFDGDAEDGDGPDRETLQAELEHAGFPAGEVERALGWLEALAGDPARAEFASTGRAIRVYDPREQARLDVDCRGYLAHLEHVGILSPSRSLSHSSLSEELDVSQLKWVVLMVLFTQNGQEGSLAQIEDLVFEGTAGALLH